MIANIGKKAINIVFNLLTLALVILILFSVCQQSIQPLINHNLNGLFIPWILLLFVRLKQMNDSRRKGHGEYRKRLSQRLNNP